MRVMKSPRSNDGYSWLMLLVALGTVSTCAAFQTSLPGSSGRISTSLSATTTQKQRSPWKGPYGARNNKPAMVTSAPRLTPLQQSSSVSGGFAGQHGAPRRPLLGRPLARLNQMRQNIFAKTSEKVPSYSNLLKFCGTTVLIWLSEPLLSLVDTTVVGWSQGASSVIQLASMGPATTLMDTLLYMTYFLALSTTNLLTQGLAQKDWRGLQRWTSYLLTTAVVVGGCVSALMMSPAGPALLNSLAGSAASPELLAYATKYTRIRALVAPFSVLGMVAQSFCLANLKSRAPLMAVAAASVINIAGDVMLRSHGVVGAAIATAVASTCATGILLRAVRTQFLQWRQLEKEEWKQEQETQAIRQELYAETDLDISSMTQTPHLPNGTEAFVLEEEMEPLAPSTTTAVLEGKPAPELMESASISSQSEGQGEATENKSLEVSTEPPPAIPFLSIPSRQSLLKLATLSGPLAVNMWAKMASYAALTIKVTSFGVTNLAAHNVLMRLFFLLGTTADAMGAAAQAFLPPCMYPLDKNAFRATLDRLRGMTGLIAVLLGQATLGLVHYAGPYIARDGAMRVALSGQAQLLAAALFLHPLVVMMEGTVIATRDFGNLMTSYAVALAVHCFSLGTASSFTGVWKAMVIFQTLRFVNLNMFRRKNPLKDEVPVPAVEAA
uniref:Protein DETOXIFICATION n=1 Tax=Amphora coffeiformis TaxID=265554 RepID=A0A7S3KZX6_9STRA|mmetsp:Transcript_5408/g.10756  ORF Transcript_5408/g.10756 Transcript_5408/m.10756 type:complete len:667 (+) Transcript_5408:159-2159(+)